MNNDFLGLKKGSESLIQGVRLPCERKAHPHDQKMERKSMIVEQLSQHAEGQHTHNTISTNLNRGDGEIV